VALMVSGDLADRAVSLDILSLKNIIVMSPEPYEEGISWPELMIMGDQGNFASLLEMEKAVQLEDPVAIMYTSGTTGQPKGVVLDHLGLINKSLCSTERQNITEQDRLCLFFPILISPTSS